eukprot:16811-Eustigmatos_ZCMA.PRE.1
MELAKIPVHRARISGPDSPRPGEVVDRWENVILSMWHADDVRPLKVPGFSISDGWHETFLLP